MEDTPQRNRPQRKLSEKFRVFLGEKEKEAEALAVVDAAREVGLEGYTKEDALRGLKNLELDHD